MVNFPSSRRFRKKGETTNKTTITGVVVGVISENRDCSGETMTEKQPQRRDWSGAQPKIVTTRGVVGWKANILK